MNRSQIDDVIVDRARRESIITIAQRLNLGKPVRRGDEVVVLCPLHSDHSPSLYLNPEKGLWHCFVCGVGGDGIMLVMEAKGLGFQDAVRWIVGSR